MLSGFSSLFHNNKALVELGKHCKPIPCNENRVFPVKFFHREIPVMKTGVPAMRTGVPCNEIGVFPVWKTSQGKPCSGPVLALYRIAVNTLTNFRLKRVIIIASKSEFLLKLCICGYGK